MLTHHRDVARTMLHIVNPLKRKFITYRLSQAYCMAEPEDLSRVYKPFVNQLD